MTHRPTPHSSGRIRRRYSPILAGRWMQHSVRLVDVSLSKPAQALEGLDYLVWLRNFYLPVEGKQREEFLARIKEASWHASWELRLGHHCRTLIGHQAARGSTQGRPEAGSLSSLARSTMRRICLAGRLADIFRKILLRSLRPRRIAPLSAPTNPFSASATRYGSNTCRTSYLPASFRAR